MQNIFYINFKHILIWIPILIIKHQKGKLLSTYRYLTPFTTKLPIEKHFDF